MDERIAALTAQIEKLQAENTFLKCLLDEVGISYVLPTPKLTVEITKQLARRFYSYFWGRTDVYSKRSVNKTTILDGEGWILSPVRESVAGWDLSEKVREEGKMRGLCQPEVAAAGSGADHGAPAGRKAGWL